MKIEELMTKDVACCRATQNLGEIAAMFWRERRGSLPVLDENGSVESMITDRDVCIALGTRNQRPNEIHVSDVVPLRVFTCRAEDDVFDALDTMVSQNVRRLPVVDANDKPVGILSIDDLIRRAAMQLPGEAKFHSAVMRTIRKICEARQPGQPHEPAELLVTHA